MNNVEQNKNIEEVPQSSIQQGTRRIGRKSNDNRVNQKSLFGPREYNSNRSIAQRIGNGFTDATHLTSPPTFQDGYGRTLNAEVPITESAQGKEFERAKDAVKNDLVIASAPMLIYGLGAAPIATALALGAGSATYGATKRTLDAVDNTLNKKYNLSLSPELKNSISFLTSIPTGAMAKRYGDDITRRGIELVMHETSGANPIPDVQRGFGTTKTGRLDALKYILTGKGKNFLTNRNGYPYYKGFGDYDVEGTSPYPDSPDIIRTYLYGEPLKGLTEVKNPDYGVHENYILKNYPGKNIKVYEADPVDYKVLRGEIPTDIKNYDSYLSMDIKDNFGKGGSYNSSGHIVQRGLTSSGRLAEREQDIGKFNPKEYGKKGIVPYREGPLIRYLPLKGGLKVVDHYGTPVIVRTPGYSVSNDNIRNFKQINPDY